jgi:hypothetical protein
VNYGRQVLTHPLIVEAAETLFVPACVYNNTTGDADAAVLEAFGERAWNNPVVRFTDAARADLVPRLAGDWSLAALAAGMVAALEKAKQDVPAYLRLLAEQEAARKKGTRSAAFAMT